MPARLRHIGHDDGFHQRGQLRHEFGQLLQVGKGFAVVEIAVAGNQHLGQGLAETIEHALHPEVGRSGGEGGAEAGGREHGNHRLGHIGHIGRNPVSGLDAPMLQGLLQPRDFGVQFAPAQTALHLIFAPEMQRYGIVIAAQQVLGEVEAGVREESRAGHALGVDQHSLAFVLGDHAGGLPHRVPELGLLGDRPIEQVLVSLQMQAVALIHPMTKCLDVRSGDALRRGQPKRLVGFGIWHDAISRIEVSLSRHAA